MSKRRATEDIDILSPQKRNDVKPWGTMPIEALERIFSYVVAAEGSAFPCLVNLGKVCSHWKLVADMRHLWTHLRFTPGNIKSKHLKRHFQCFRNFSVRFRETHSLVCSGLENSAAHIAQEICMNANQIRSFALIDCGRLGNPLKSCLKTLVERHGKSIQSFTLRQTSHDSSTLRKCLLEFGESLTTLEATQVPSPYCTVTNGRFSHLINLTVLKLQGDPDFDLDCLKDLHRLKTVHITDSGIVGKECVNIRWPELEDCDFSCSELVERDIDMRTNPEILQVLKHSPKVKKINLSGTDMDLSCLCEVLQNCNEIVYLSIIIRKRRHTSPDGLNIGSLLNCIGDSLRTLYLNGSTDLDESLSSSKSYPHYWHHLINLSMESTNICGNNLKYFLHHCLLNVKTINLCKCRGLPRGCKRKWTDISALKKVLEKSGC